MKIHKHNPVAAGFSIGYLGDAMSEYTDEAFAADVAGTVIREEREMPLDEIDELDVRVCGTLSQIGSTGFHTEVRDLIAADERKLHGLLVSAGIAEWKANQGRKGTKKRERTK